MTLLQWIIFIAIVQIIHFAGTWKLYQKAGRKPWEALVPIYNAIILMQIIGRPKWWVLLLFIPVINLIMFPVIWVETIRSFGKNTNLDTFLVLITFGLYIFYINYTQDVQHIKERDLKPKNAVADFISSVVFAVIVATTIHTYLLQPFTIPTGSLEKTLLVGDFLFVSKVNYGARTPMTSVALPMVHDTIPMIPTSYEGLPKKINRFKSYLNTPQIPYFRFPGFEEVEKNDIVVFNWPIDTVRFFGDKTAKNVRKPIDKKSNYVKRCVGTPGDTLEGKNGEIYINGEILTLSHRAKPQYMHEIETSVPLSQEFVSKHNLEFTRFYKINKEIWNDPKAKEFFNNRENQVYLTEVHQDSTTVEVMGYIGVDLFQKLGMELLQNKIAANLTVARAEELKKDPQVNLVERISFPNEKKIFPHTKDWSQDNFGPLYIPKAGTTVPLNKESIAFYELIIREYEGHDLKIIGNDIIIDGKPATSYTFEKDYYWMMGDNRHNSEDSRYWGYVPADHIVGKPVFIWMSWDANGTGLNKIRWDRVFTTVDGNGEPKSYFRWFLIALAGYFAFDYFRKKKTKKA